MARKVRRTTNRPTQSDVARLAGVSPAIVSVVVNDREGGPIRVAAATRQRVWAAVRQLGYVPNPVARTLAGGRTRLLGVFTYELVFPMDEPNFYHPFLVGIEEEAEALDYDLVLFTRTDQAGKRRIYRNGVNELQITEGAVLLGTNEDRDEIARLARDGFPFVFIGRRDSAAAAISYVAADYVEATRKVLEHIFAAGHRRVALFRGRGEHESMQDRRRGYRKAHENAGIRIDEELVVRAEANGVTTDLVQTILARGATAFVSESAATCDALERAASLLGLRIPEDVSLASLGNNVDEVELADNVTTFEVPRRDMGRTAVRLLEDVLVDPTPQRAVLKCRFRPGRTVGPPGGVGQG